MEDVNENLRKKFSKRLGMKKIISNILAVFLTFCMSLSLVGCKEEPIPEGPIPNGRYEPLDLSNLTRCFYIEDEKYDYYWLIENDTASFTTSGWQTYEGKIVEKDGIIYFEGYKWESLVSKLEQLLFWEERKPIRLVGSTDVYIVEYNEEEKSITVELYKKGE